MAESDDEKANQTGKEIHDELRSSWKPSNLDIERVNTEKQSRGQWQAGRKQLSKKRCSGSQTLKPRKRYIRECSEKFSDPVAVVNLFQTLANFRPFLVGMAEKRGSMEAIMSRTSSSASSSAVFS